MLVFSPVILLSSICGVFAIGYTYIVITSISGIFERNYHFSEGVVGLTYLGLSRIHLPISNPRELSSKTN